MLSFVLMVPAIIVAEKKNKTKPVFNGAILLILLTQLGFGVFGEGLWSLSFFLFPVLRRFNIARGVVAVDDLAHCPPQSKGLALGI